MRRAATSVAAVVLLVAVLGAGLWFLGAIVAGTTNAAVLLTGLWFAAVGAVVLLITRGRPALRWALRGAFAATTAALLAIGAYTSLHETTVDERLERGAPASRVVPPAAVDDLLAPQE